MLKIYRKEYAGVTLHRYIFIDDSKATVWSTGDHKVIPATRADIYYPLHIWQDFTLKDGFELVSTREGI